MVAYLFLSTPTARHWFVQLYFSQPEFVFVTGSLICISHGLTLYFSPKCFISRSGIIPEPAVRFAFSKGQNPSESNFPNHGHVVQSLKSFAAVLGPIWFLKMPLERPKHPKMALTTNFPKTVYQQGTAQHSAVFQAR